MLLNNFLGEQEFESNIFFVLSYFPMNCAKTYFDFCSDLIFLILISNKESSASYLNEAIFYIKIALLKSHHFLYNYFCYYHLLWALRFFKATRWMGQLVMNLFELNHLIISYFFSNLNYNFKVDFEYIVIVQHKDSQYGYFQNFCFFKWSEG